MPLAGDCPKRADFRRKKGKNVPRNARLIASLGFFWQKRRFRRAVCYFPSLQYAKNISTCIEKFLHEWVYFYLPAVKKKGGCLFL